MTTLRGYKTNLTSPQIADIKLAHARGVPVAVIAKTFGVSTSTVYAQVSGSRRTPCPRCGVPMAVTSNTCRKCSDTRAAAAAARSGWAQQAPRRQAEQLGRLKPPGRPSGPPSPHQKGILAVPRLAQRGAPLGPGRTVRGDLHPLRREPAVQPAGLYPSGLAGLRLRPAPAVARAGGGRIAAPWPTSPHDSNDSSRNTSLTSM